MAGAPPAIRDSSVRYGTIPGMARPAKVVQLGLEHELLSCRERGLTLEAIVEHLNRVLADRDAAMTVSRNAVTRYLASLGQSCIWPRYNNRQRQGASSG
jgi:hypothetical protein